MNNETVKHTPEIDVYTVLSVAERGLNWYSEETKEHHTAVLEKTRSLIEYAPELLEALKDAFERITDNGVTGMFSYELKTKIANSILKAEGR